jgi:hypothetical protein
MSGSPAHPGKLSRCNSFIDNAGTLEHGTLKSDNQVVQLFHDRFTMRRQC